MKTEDIEIASSIINKTIDENREKICALIASDDRLFPTDRERALAHVCGEYAGTLLFIQDALLKELEIRKSKKFWQFWK